MIAMVMFALSATVLLIMFEITIKNVHYLDHDLYNRPRSNVKLSIERPYVISCLMAKVMLSIFVNNCKIITFKLLKRSRFDSLITKKEGNGQEVQRHQLRHWMTFSIAKILVKKIADLSQTFFVWSANDEYTYTRDTHSDDNKIPYASYCFSPKNYI